MPQPEVVLTQLVMIFTGEILQIYSSGADKYSYLLNKLSAYDYEIQPKGKQLCLTDIQIAVPQGTYGRVAPRSGLAHKNFIDVGGLYTSKF